VEQEEGDEQGAPEELDPVEQRAAARDLPVERDPDDERPRMPASPSPSARLAAPEISAATKRNST
jgi:hypothetical protein